MSKEIPVVHYPEEYADWYERFEISNHYPEEYANWYIRYISEKREH